MKTQYTYMTCPKCGAVVRAPKGEEYEECPRPRCCGRMQTDEQIKRKET